MNTVATPAPSGEGERLLEASEVADRLRISLTSVYRLVRSGELRSHRFGQGRVRPRGLRIPESAVDERLRLPDAEPEAA